MPSCNPGQMWCSLDGGSESDPTSGFCDDTQIDPMNCGGCFLVCDAGFSCVTGVCMPPACADAGPTSCVPDGGICPTGLLCPLDGGGVACVDPREDPDNCGGCGLRCCAGDSCNGGCATSLAGILCDGGRPTAIYAADAGCLGPTAVVCQ